MTNTIAATDRAQYEAWVAAQLERVHTYGGSGFDVWDTSKLRRARMVRIDADGYKGPWRSVRPYATAEFISWIEQAGEPRWTFGEWQRAMRTERAAEVVATSDTLASLDTLAYMRDLIGRRGELIATAREGGATWAQIQDATGLSRMQCHTLAKAHAHPVALEVEPAAVAGWVAAGFASAEEYAAALEEAF